MGEINTKILDNLLDNPPAGCEDVANLYVWSGNYDYKDGNPYCAFLDLIGYSMENYGEKLNPRHYQIDHISADSFAGALKRWSERPNDVVDYIIALENGERGEE